MDLGRLEKVNVRQIWENEATHFTPWLGKEENLKLLGESIGINLELEAQEKNVGLFRADLLCKDMNTDNWVLIENQIERTDHKHLGQLLTYASGLKAVTIVWIAQNFTDEHRSALDWLNEITNDRFNFFGLEIELWKIADSPAAPKFNIISKPNDWSKTVAASASQIENEALTETQLLQKSFWQGFREFVKEKGAEFKPTKALPQHWMNIAIGKSGANLSAIASMFNSELQTYDSNEIRAEFYLYDENAKEYYNELLSQKEAIEKEMGQSLVWYNPDDARNCKIYIRKSTELRDDDNWPEYHAWLLEKLNKLYVIFSDRIKKI